MEKPIAKTFTRFDWVECTKWVEHKLGYPIRDTLGKFREVYPNDIKYRDFWRFICDSCDPTNGSEIYLDIDRDLTEAWQDEILDCYIKEFGEGPYWCEW